MARNVISLMTGIVVSFLVIFSVQMVNYQLFPLPPNVNPQDFEAMTKHAKELPALAHWIVLFSHILGSITGAYVVTKIAESAHVKLAIGLGVFLLIMGVITIFRLPHPMWFTLVDILVYVPSAYLGYLLGRKF